MIPSKNFNLSELSYVLCVFISFPRPSCRLIKLRQKRMKLLIFLLAPLSQNYMSYTQNIYCDNKVYNQTSVVAQKFCRKFTGI